MKIPCVICNSIVITCPSRPRKYCSMKCRGIDPAYIRNLSTSLRPKSGKTMTSQGYIQVQAIGHPKRQTWGHSKYEHILVAEQKIGRVLKDNECVHHLNGNKKDNREENLLVMTRSEHARYHWTVKNPKHKGEYHGSYTASDALRSVSR